MSVRLHPHARARIVERGATEEEVVATAEAGERFPAKMGRVGFRRNFTHADMWRGVYFGNKQVEVFAVRENDDWLLLTVVV